MPVIVVYAAGVDNLLWYGLALAIPPLLASLVAVRGQHGLLDPGPEAEWSELSTNLTLAVPRLARRAGAELRGRAGRARARPGTGASATPPPTSSSASSSPASRSCCSRRSRPRCCPSWPPCRVRASTTTSAAGCVKLLGIVVGVGRARDRRRRHARTLGRPAALRRQVQPEQPGPRAALRRERVLHPGAHARAGADRAARARPRADRVDRRAGGLRRRDGRRAARRRRPTSSSAPSSGTSPGVRRRRGDDGHLPGVPAARARAPRASACSSRRSSTNRSRSDPLGVTDGRAPIRVALDGTPLLGNRTGIGEVVARARRRSWPTRPSSTSPRTRITWRGRTTLVAGRSRRASAPRPRPIPARLSRARWMRSDHPRIERWTGTVDVVHATNYVPPPARSPVVVVGLRPRIRALPRAVHRRRAPVPHAPAARLRARRAWSHATSDFVADEVQRRVRPPRGAGRAGLPGRSAHRRRRRRRGQAARRRGALRARGRDDRAPQEPAGARRARSTGSLRYDPEVTLVVAGPGRLGYRRVRRRGATRASHRAASTGSATSPPPSGATSSPARSCSPTPRATKGSDSRPSRRWPPVYRWSPPEPARFPR